MNKLLIFFCIFVFVTSKCYNNTAGNTAKTCKTFNVSTSDGESGDACCFVSYTNGTTEYKFCQAYKKNDVPQIVKNNTQKVTKLSIDCSSNWISYSLFLVALVFMI